MSRTDRIMQVCMLLAGKINLFYFVQLVMVILSLSLEGFGVKPDLLGVAQVLVELKQLFERLIDVAQVGVV